MLAFHSLDSLLPDDLILVGLSFVEANDLINFQATCRRYRNLETEDLPGYGGIFASVDGGTGRRIRPMLDYGKIRIEC